MIEIGGAHGMGVQFDAAEVHDPRQAGGIVDHNFFGGAAGGKRERNRAEPGRAVGGRALLIKRFSFRTVDESLEHDGAVRDPLQGAGSDRQVVVHEIELG